MNHTKKESQISCFVTPEEDEETTYKEKEKEERSISSYARVRIMKENSEENS